MESRNELLKQKITRYTDKELIEKAQDGRNQTSEEEMKIIEQIMFERGLNPTFSFDENDSNDANYSPPPGVKIYSAQPRSPITNRIDGLVEDVEGGEEQIGKLLIDQYTNLSDSDLKSLYEKMIVRIKERNQFGEEPQEDSIRNYKLLLDEFTKRKLSVSKEVEKAHASAYKLMLSIFSKRYRNKGWFNLLAAFFQLFIVAGFIWDGAFVFSLSIFFVLGLYCLLTGVKQISKWRNLRQRRSYDQYYVTKL